MIPTRRRRMRGVFGATAFVSAVTTVAVSPDGDGTWTLAIGGSPCGEGAFTNLAATCSPAPSGGQVDLTLTVDGGAPGISATITAGNTSGSGAGPQASTADAEVTANTGAGNTVSLSGSVTFTRTSDSRAFTFALQAYSLAP